jgi:hypothetical protein
MAFFLPLIFPSIPSRHALAGGLFEMLDRQVSINLRGLYVLVPEQLLERIEVNAAMSLCEA